MQVLIVGGGIGGLAAALSLHAAGIGCTVFEQVQKPAELGVGPLLAAWPATMPNGFTLPMLLVTTVFLLIFVVALLLGPETKGKILVSDIEPKPAPQASSVPV